MLSTSTNGVSDHDWNEEWKLDDLILPYIDNREQSDNYDQFTSTRSIIP